MKEYPSIDKHLQFYELYISKINVKGVLTYYLYTQPAFGAASGIGNETYGATLLDVLDKLEETLSNKYGNNSKNS